MANDIVEFIKAALRNPMEVSTVFPTSQALAETLLGHADLTGAKTVVELGAGTGAITRHLVKRLTAGKRYLGIELDARLVDFLRREFSGLQFDLHFEAGPAKDLPKWIASGSADVVVSSLPWSVFSATTQEETIAAILGALRPGGVFVTYVCVNAMVYPNGQAFLRKLRANFAQVERSPLEWRNMPPAYVFKSTKS